jgi:hypothetical protein
VENDVQVQVWPVQVHGATARIDKFAGSVSASNGKQADRRSQQGGVCAPR